MIRNCVVRLTHYTPGRWNRRPHSAIALCRDHYAGSWLRTRRLCSVPVFIILAATGLKVSATEPPAKKDHVLLAATPHEKTRTPLKTPPTYSRDVLPILMGKCARCHSGQTQVMPNWLDYKTAETERWEIKRRIWDSWKGTYFKQPMPTANSPESQAISEEERATILNWVESGARYGTARSLSGVQSKAERIEAGRHLFAVICASCHQPSGRGIAGRFPPLAGSDLLNSDKHRAIQVLVNGLQGEVVVNGQRFNNTMPKFPLSDEDIASALTFVYSSFGNSGQDVTPQEVSSVRSEKASNMRNQTAKTPEEKSPYE